MADEPSAPADTTMMRIVHDALRRDLRRAQAVLTKVPPPGDRRSARELALYRPCGLPATSSAALSALCKTCFDKWGGRH